MSAFIFFKIRFLLETFVLGPLNPKVLELYDPNVLYISILLRHAFVSKLYVKYIVAPCFSCIVLYRLKWPKLGAAMV